MYIPIYAHIYTQKFPLQTAVPFQLRVTPFVLVATASSSARGRDLANAPSPASEKKCWWGHLAFKDECEPAVIGRLNRADRAEQGAGEQVLPCAGQL